MKKSRSVLLRFGWITLLFFGLFSSTGVFTQIQSAQNRLPPSDRVASPVDNPSNPSIVELGRLLFWDPILSGNKDVACATCHHPDFGYAENLDISIGVNGVGLGSARHFNEENSIPFVQRNSQSVLNTAFNGIDEEGSYDPQTAPMFWDLRAKGLEELYVVRTFWTDRVLV